LDVAEFGEEVERILPTDGVPGAGLKHPPTPAAAA
jgi:hypothetical protein